MFLINLTHELTCLWRPKQPADQSGFERNSILEIWSNVRFMDVCWNMLMNTYIHPFGRSDCKDFLLESI